MFQRTTLSIDELDLHPTRFLNAGRQRKLPSEVGGRRCGLGVPTYRDGVGFIRRKGIQTRTGLLISPRGDLGRGMIRHVNPQEREWAALRVDSLHGDPRTNLSLWLGSFGREQVGEVRDLGWIEDRRARLGLQSDERLRRKPRSEPLLEFLERSRGPAKAVAKLLDVVRIGEKALGELAGIGVGLASEAVLPTDQIAVATRGLQTLRVTEHASICAR
ncbi:MAG: hypothetical protein AAGA54_27515 [Myxococcota bacterium]